MQKPAILTLTLALSVVALQAGPPPPAYDKVLREPAVEDLGGPYWAIYGGVDLHQTADASDDAGDFGRFANDLEGDTGWFAGIKFGHDFDSPSAVHAAVEIEAQYTNVDADFGFSGGGFRADSGGEIHAASLMVNGLIKFKPVWSIRPYIGGGVGIAHLWLRDAETEISVGGVEIGETVHEDDEEWTFVYQGIAGIDWWVTDNFTVFTEYKAMVFHDAVGLENYLHHMVGIGLRFKF